MKVPRLVCSVKLNCQVSFFNLFVIRRCFKHPYVFIYIFILLFYQFRLKVLKNDSRLDLLNSGCYKSSSTIASVGRISRKSPTIKVERYSFSEAQAGKSNCDRMAAQVKRKIHEYVDQNHNVANPKEFFDALGHGKLLQDVSFYLAKLVRKNANTKKYSIAGVSYMNDFHFDDDGVTAYKHSEIGRGKKISLPDELNEDCELTLVKEGALLPTCNEFFSDVQQFKTTSELNSDKDQSDLGKTPKMKIQTIRLFSDAKSVPPSFCNTLDINAT